MYESGSRLLIYECYEYDEYEYASSDEPKRTPLPSLVSGDDGRRREYSDFFLV